VRGPAVSCRRICRSSPSASLPRRRLHHLQPAAASLASCPASEAAGSLVAPLQSSVGAKLLCARANCGRDSADALSKACGTTQMCWRCRRRCTRLECAERQRAWQGWALVCCTRAFRHRADAGAAPADLLDQGAHCETQSRRLWTKSFIDLPGTFAACCPKLYFTITAIPRVIVEGRHGFLRPAQRASAALPLCAEAQCCCAT